MRAADAVSRAAGAIDLPRRSTLRWGLVVLALAVSLCASRIEACDVCAIYTATEQRESRAGLRLGIAEQFTRFTTLKKDGEKLDNPGEHLTSSTTQLVLGYDVTRRFGVQLALPIIDRTFRRREHGVITSGNESGVGDLSLLAIVRPFSHVASESIVRTSLLAGLEFPTGSADRLREEAEETAAAHADGGGGALHAPAMRAGRSAHEVADDGPLGVHGHDLALGSGSVDGIVGGTLFASWQRFFWTTTVQYAMRTEGSFDYRYANDVTWSGGPGVFPYLQHELSVSLSSLLSGEHKGRDTQGDREVDDTGLTAVYMGPALGATWGTTLAADVAVDFPILQDNTAIQIVPDYRIRAGVSWRF
jgi:hypothetical protein